MGELGALFNPGMRHELEERRARAARREEEGNARDGDLRIDLDSGVAVINAPDDEGSAADEGSVADEGDERADDPQAPDARPNSGTEQAGPAADRDEPADQPVDASTAGNASVAGKPDDAPAAPLRPRGKRAMSSSKR